MGRTLDYTNDLLELTSLALQPHALSEVLVRALSSLRTVIPYDLAAVYELKGQELVVAAADGPLVNEQVRHHKLPLENFPTIQRALETRRPIPLEEHHHTSHEGDPYDDILELPHGHSCMVVPLFAGQRDLGLITLDQATCGVYPPESVELAGVYGQLVSTALIFAEQAMLLERYRHQLKEENRLLTEEIGGAEVACERIASSRSSKMKDVARLAKQVAVSDLPVLISGETGTGKEVLAQAIHSWSRRVDGPFIKLNCAAIPESLVESELFGHVRGAFSGASSDRRGRFLTANGGTLFLDEIGDMPLAAQSKLLRVLQEGTFEAVGSDTQVRVDVRIIAASHRDLLKAVQEGKFREDLYYRLAVFPLEIPPLRERAEDVGAIAQGYLEHLAQRERRGPWSLESGALRALERHPWPGNVRQLINTLERATILQPAGAVSASHLGLPASKSTHVRVEVTAPASPWPSFEDNERQYLKAALAQTGGKIYGPNGAALLVGLKPTTLQSKLKKLGLKR